MTGCTHDFLIEDGPAAGGKRKPWRCQTCDDVMLFEPEQYLPYARITADGKLALRRRPACERHTALIGAWRQDLNDIAWTCTVCHQPVTMTEDAMAEYIQTVDQGRPALIWPDGNNVPKPEPVVAAPALAAPSNVVEHPRLMEVQGQKLRIQCCGKCGGTTMNIYTTEAHPGSKHFAIAIRCADAACLSVMMEQSN